VVTDGKNEATPALVGAAVLDMTCCVWFEQPAIMNMTVNTASQPAFFIDNSSWLSSKGLFLPSQGWLV
jgi:hypothetical protein